MKHKIYLIGLAIYLILNQTVLAQVDLRLLEAIQQNDLSGMQARIKQKKRVLNRCDDRGASPLMWAAYKSDLSIVRYLVEQGSRLDLQGTICLDDTCGGYYGNLVCIAAGEGKLDILRYFIDSLNLPYNALEWNPLTRKNDGWSPMDWAVFRNQKACMKYLTPKLSVDEQNQIWFNLIVNQNLTGVERAIEMELPINLKDQFGYTPLLRAAALNLPYTVAILIAAGSDINTQNTQGKKASDLTTNIFIHGILADTAVVRQPSALYLLEVLEWKEKPRFWPDIKQSLDTFWLTDYNAMKWRIYWDSCGHQIEGLNRALSLKSIVFASYLLNKYNMRLKKADCRYSKSIELCIENNRKLPNFDFNEVDSLWKSSLSIRRQPQYNIAEKLSWDTKYLSFLMKNGEFEAANNYWKTVFESGTFNLNMSDTSDIVKRTNLFVTLMTAWITLKMEMYETSFNSFDQHYQYLKNVEKCPNLEDDFIEIFDILASKLNIESKLPLELMLKTNDCCDQKFQNGYSYKYQYGFMYSEQYAGNPSYTGCLNLFKKLGDAYFRAGEYTNAKFFYQKYRNAGFHWDDENMCANLSKIFYFEHQKDSALYYFEKMSEIRNSAFRTLWKHHESKIQEILYSRSTHAEYTLALCHKYDSGLAKEAYNEAINQSNVGIKLAKTIRNLVDTSTVPYLKDRYYLLSKLHDSIYFSQDRSLFSANDFEKIDQIRSSLSFEIGQIYQDSMEFVAYWAGYKFGSGNRGDTMAMLNELKKIRIVSFSKQFSYTWKDVQSSLQLDEAAIEFVRFPELGSDTIIYAALILRSDWDQPKMILLCNEADLKEFLALEDPQKIYSYREDITNSGQNDIKMSLYSLIWGPLKDLLKGVNSIFISPSGLLSKVAFHAINTPQGMLLMDQFNLHNLTSTRDLINRTKKPFAYPKTGLIVGNIDFDKENQSVQGQQNSNNRDLHAYFLRKERSNKKRDHLTPLEGSKTEKRNILRFCNRASITTTQFEENEATEEAIKRSLSMIIPDFIHLATHGFAFEKPYDLKENKIFKNYHSIGINDPMVRSGLALAGSNYAWKEGRARVGREDGLWLAAEIIPLNLKGCQLAVLSACDTGLGDIVGGEGVMGLPRAFKIAGVDKVIATLWSIPDEPSAYFMTTFYREYLVKKLPIEESFRNAQKITRKKYIGIKDWGAFILVE